LSGESALSFGCRGLAPWRVFTALDATGLARGGSRSLLSTFKREAPRGKPVASGLLSGMVFVAASVKLHGKSPWHLAIVSFVCPWNLAAHVNYWSLVGIFFCLTKNFVRDRCGVALAEGDVLQQV
jgi:hypothetical protein